MNYKLISVEQHHINHGVKNSYCHCPIALAVKEQLGYPHVTIGAEGYCHYDEALDRDVWSHTPLSRSARRFMRTVDVTGGDNWREKVKPFKFYLEVP